MNVNPSAMCRQVACGARHSCALTQAGSLYTWGCNLHRQCGVPCQAGANVLAPTLVQSLGGLKVTCVAAGLHHAIVCTDAGEPWHLPRMVSDDAGSSSVIYLRPDDT